MSWDPVPWFVGGGAQHSPEVARLLAHAATSGAEGIVGVKDLRVRPLSVPGTSVRVSPGAALIRDRTSGNPQQTYVSRLPSQDTVEIAPTGSGGGRTDLVVARVEDPYTPGAPWQDPEDPAVGPYMFTRVITNVPAGTTSVADLDLGYSAIPLARINIPKSTGTITSNMITDLREVAIPRRERVLLADQVYAETTDRLGATVDEAWPDPTVMEWYVDIPEWATEVSIVMTWGGIESVNNFNGWVWARLIDGADQIETAKTRINTLAGTSRDTIVVADTIRVPSALRGRRHVRFVGRGNKTDGTGTLTIDGGSMITADIEFTERPDVE